MDAARNGSVGSFAGFSAVVLGVAFVIAGAIYVLLERPLMDRGALLASRYLRPAESRPPLVRTRARAS